MVNLEAFALSKGMTTSYAKMTQAEQGHVALSYIWHRQRRLCEYRALETSSGKEAHGQMGLLIPVCNGRLRGLCWQPLAPTDVFDHQGGGEISRNIGIGILPPYLT